ncbi:MAG: alcohol dehydrogenase catalytic domain-containing protein [Pyrodictiaceae archaeon]
MAAKRMKSLRIGYGVFIEESLLPPIRKGWVLVRTISAAWDGVEEAEAAGLIWVKPGRVPGIQGYGVVVELGVGAPSWLAGKRVVIARLPRYEEVEALGLGLWALVDGIGPLPGTAYDGWLSEYVSLPSSSLEPIDTSLPAEYASIATTAAIARAAAGMMVERGDRLAIVGAGPSALLAGIAMERMGVFYEVFSSSMAWAEVAKKLGVEVKRLGEIRVEKGRGYDAVFLATLDHEEAVLAADMISPGGLLVLHPIYSYVEPPRTRKGCIKLIREFPVQAGLVLLSSIKDSLAELVEVVEGLVKPPVPRPKPFISYLLSSL